MFIPHILPIFGKCPVRITSLQDGVGSGRGGVKARLLVLWDFYSRADLVYFPPIADHNERFSGTEGP